MKKLTPEDLERSSIPKEHWMAVLDRIPGEARKAINNYLDPKSGLIDEGAGLLLSGDPGVGKTSAACVVAKVCRARGKTVFFITPPELREANKAKSNFEDDLSIVQRCRSVDLLILDQWDDADLKDYYIGAKFVADLLRYRRSRQLPTIITSRYSSFGDDEIASASVGYLVPVTLEGPDQRQGKAEELAKKVFKK